MDNSELLQDLLTECIAARSDQLRKELDKARVYLPETDSYDAATQNEMWRPYANYYDWVLGDVVDELIKRGGKLGLEQPHAIEKFLLQFQSDAETLRHTLSEELELKPKGPGQHDAVQLLNGTTITARDSQRARLETEIIPEVSKALIRSQQLAAKPSTLLDLADPIIRAEHDKLFDAVKKKTRDMLSQMAAKGQIGFGPGHLA